MKTKHIILLLSAICVLLDTTTRANSAPFATTLPVTQITGASASLNGAVTPNLLPTSAWFQWGTNAAYGNQTATLSAGSGATVTWASTTISNLIASQPYHYRLVASNSSGVTYGADQLFGAAKKVWAWGYNASGQTNVPAGLSNSVAAAGGGSHSLALNANGNVTAWGYDYYGETNVPTSLSNFVAIVGGYNDSMALQSNGTVVVWGDNTYGQTNVPPAVSNIMAVAAGDSHCLALQSNGTVVAWGLNDDGQTNVPSGLSNVVAIAAGGSHNLALLNNGTVTAWGDNVYGETNVPPGLSNVIAITAGLYHCVALQSNGLATVWGDNSYGQKNVPATATNLVAISAGRLHTLALRSGGTLVAWGNNADGQTNIPSGVTNAISVAAGGYHNLALTLGHLPVAVSLTIITANPGNPPAFEISLSGSDPDGYPVSFIILTLPSTGYLYGAYGPTITNPDTPLITYYPGVVVYYLGSLALASPYATFQVAANYGYYVSAPATITVDLGASPSVTTQSAATFAGTNAALAGTAMPNALPTGAWFQWGLTTSYGNTTSVSSLGAGTNNVSFSNTIAGLLPLQVYHYRIVASNALGTMDSADAIFHTIVPPFSLASANFLPSGAFHITFAGTPNTTYSLWSSSNLMNWIQAGYSSEDLPGQYEADDSTATNRGQRFYQLRWP